MPRDDALSRTNSHDFEGMRRRTGGIGHAVISSGAAAAAPAQDTAVVGENWRPALDKRNEYVSPFAPLYYSAADQCR